MAKWTDWALAWDGRAAYKEKLPIAPEQLPANWIQWRYRYQINTGFAQDDAVGSVQTFLGLIGAGVASMAVGQFNGKEFQQKVIFDIIDIAKWEITTKFTVVSIAYQIGAGGFAFYTWYSSRQELITYLPGTGNTLGLENGSASVVRARELDKYHPVANVVTSTSGESYPWIESEAEVTGDPLTTLGAQGLIVTQDSTSGIGYPNDVQFYGWFIGPMYNLYVPTGALIDIKFHNIGVPVGDRWAYIETRTSAALGSPGAIPKTTSFQGDNLGTEADKNFKPQDGKNSDLKNAFFAAGATDNIGRSEIYYPDATNNILRQFLGVTDFEETRDKYSKAIVMGNGSGTDITFPSGTTPVDTSSIMGNAPEFIKNQQGVSSLFYHMELSGKLLQVSALYRSLMSGVALQTKSDFSNLATGKIKIIFGSSGSYTIQEIDAGTSNFIEKIIIYNNRLAENKTYEFTISSQESNNITYFFIANDDQKKAIYYVQSSDEGETWERNLGNIENANNYNNGNLTIGGETVSGIQTNPNYDPLLIAENESFPISIKDDEIANTKLFTIRNTKENYNLIARNYGDIDIYSQRVSEAQTRDETIENTQAMLIGGSLTPNIHQGILDNILYSYIGALQLKNIDYNPNSILLDKQYYVCLAGGCLGNMAFLEYRNSGTGNDDVEDLDKKYDQIIYKCDVCSIEYDLIALFGRELMVEQPISVVKLPTGENRLFYIIGPQDWELETNYINITSASSYDYIPFLEGFEITLNNTIQDSTWNIYVNEKGAITYTVDPTEASTSVLSMSAENNKMIWSNSFSFALRNTSGGTKIFSIPNNVLISRYTQDGDSYIYDKQLNRSMMNFGHSAILAKYSYESNIMKIFSYKDGALLLNEYPQTILNSLQKNRKDRGLLKLSEEELKENVGMAQNKQVFFIIGQVKKDYQENINNLPNKYFLANFSFKKNAYEEGKIKQYYCCPEEIDGNICSGLMFFDSYNSDDEVIYRCDTTDNELNLTQLTANNVITEQIISYNETTQGVERIYYQKNGKNIIVTTDSVHTDIYNGFTVTFGELQEGWVSIVFNNTIQQGDLIVKGTASNSIASVTIEESYLANREIRFTIVESDGEYTVTTEASPAVLVYKNNKWTEDSRNI